MARLLDMIIGTDGDFAAYNKAAAALHGCGFSVGRMQAHAPTGIMFGDLDIQKWRNLSKVHRALLHGTITGDFRNGPVRVQIAAPNDDVAARLTAALCGPQTEPPEQAPVAEADVAAGVATFGRAAA